MRHFVVSFTTLHTFTIQHMHQYNLYQVKTSHWTCPKMPFDQTLKYTITSRWFYTKIPQGLPGKDKGIFFYLPSGQTVAYFLAVTHQLGTISFYIIAVFILCNVIFVSLLPYSWSLFYKKPAHVLLVLSLSLRLICKVRCCFVWPELRWKWKKPQEWDPKSVMLFSSRERIIKQPQMQMRKDQLREGQILSFWYLYEV